MQPLNIYEFTKLAGLIKASQIPPQFRKHKHDPLAAAYPDYDRALLTQYTENPRQAGTTRAVGTGLTAAVLGGLIARLLSSNPAVVGGSALGAGALGAIPGYISGKREAESEHSKLLFLRRLGISRPGELDVLLKHPEMAARVTEEGAKI